MEDVEYRPQRGFGTSALFRACVAAVLAAMLFSLGSLSLAAVYLAAFPAVVAVASFAAYGMRRRLRCRLTATAIETRRLRTRVIPWAQIRDIKVLNWVTVAEVPVLGSRMTGRYPSRSGRGGRKLAAVRVQRVNGRWVELAMPVAKENAPDPDFTSKAKVIQDRWRAVTGQLPVG